MSQKRSNFSSYNASTLSRKKVALTYVIRDKCEKLNRSGVNKLLLDNEKKWLYSAGRDAIVRCWDVSNDDYVGEEVCVEYIVMSCSKIWNVIFFQSFKMSLEHHTDWVNDIVLCSNNNTRKHVCFPLPHALTNTSVHWYPSSSVLLLVQGVILIVVLHGLIVDTASSHQT